MRTNKRLHHSPRPGFTLIELLAVIAIIALLIGILVPSISVVRTKAKSVATRATIASLGTGIESFRAENRLGGAYPPSASDGSGSLVYKVANPYSNIGITGANFDISGAGLLAFALSGADLLGTPGFRTFNSSSTAWAEDTSDLSGGAYELDSDTKQPLKPRFGPYVDDKVRVSQYNSVERSFDIEAEVEARDALGKQRVQRKYPMYLDAFGFPLLYYRADPAGIGMYDRDPNGPSQGPVKRGFYHWIHNGSLVKKDDPEELVLASSGLDHNLKYSTPPPAGTDPDQLTDQFAYFIWNQTVAARHMPHNAQTYLLFSPGPDGRYGTSDDIGNFTPSGE